MKSTTFVAILFALSVLIMAVSGQNSPSTNSTSTTSPPPPASTVDQNQIDQCIKMYACSETDLDCRAKCANVPNPSHTNAQNTDDCVSKCNQNDTNAYAQCKQNCINSNYYSPSATPNSGNAANTNAPPSSSQSASGSSNSSSGSTPSSTSKANNTNGASSFTTNSNAFTALVLCVIAGVMAIS